MQRDTWLYTELSNKSWDLRLGTASDLLGTFRQTILSIFLCFPNSKLVVTKLIHTYPRKSCGCKVSSALTSITAKLAVLGTSFCWEQRHHFIFSSCAPKGSNTPSQLFLNPDWKPTVYLLMVFPVGYLHFHIHLLLYYWFTGFSTKWEWDWAAPISSISLLLSNSNSWDLKSDLVPVAHIDLYWSLPSSFMRGTEIN